jgi:L-threonylcarbamoyladenylate synthase
MRILSLTPENMQKVVAETADILRNGGVVLYPTDTLYGLGADAFSNEAVDKIYALKGRDPQKPMHAIAQNLAMIETVGEVSVEAKILADAFWPGPLTLVLKKKIQTETGIARGIETIGVRIPNNAFCQAVSESFNGLVTTTSANLSGATPTFSVQDILRQLGGKAELIDFIIDEGTLPESKPSTIVDLSNGAPILLREGAIRAEDVTRYFSL